MSGIINRKLDLGNARDPQVVEQIREPRESTFTALTPDTDVRSLLKHVSGHPWTVTYYGQIVNSDSVLNHIDVKSGHLAQSYVEINDLTLKVQSTLSHDYDQEQGTTTLSGNAIAPYGIRPYPGDVFRANVDSGEDVIFVVSDVTRLSHRKNTLYSIEYNSLAWVNDNNEFQETLNRRINEKYYYDNHINSVNKNILLNEEDKFHMDKLLSFLYQSKIYYFETFRQITTSSMIVPGADVKAFDKLLIDFIHRTVDVSKFNTLYTYTYSNYAKAYDSETILDALIKRTLPTSERRFTRKCGFVSSSAFPRRASLMSAIFSGVEYISYPFASRDFHTASNERVITEGDGIDIRTDRNYTGPNYKVDTVTRHEVPFSTVLLPTLFDDNYYIVSKEFYDYLEDPDNYANLSFVELTIYKYLNGEEISKEDLFKILLNWEDWSYLHQFYILPVMWLIAKSTLGVV